MRWALTLDTTGGKADIVFYCRNCTKFVQLILTKIVVTRCQILRVKCTKFDCGWGSAQTPLGELTALPRPSSWWGRGLSVPSPRSQPPLMALWASPLLCLEVFHKY